MEPVIVLDHLSKSFGHVHAVQDVTLKIAPGAIFGFLGANGAGKTTTIRMLCGLTHPTEWQGHDRRETTFGKIGTLRAPNSATWRNVSASIPI